MPGIESYRRGKDTAALDAMTPADFVSAVLQRLHEDMSIVGKPIDDRLRSMSGFDAVKYERLKFEYLVASVVLALAARAHADQLFTEVLDRLRVAVRMWMKLCWGDEEGASDDAIQVAADDLATFVLRPPADSERAAIEFGERWIKNSGVDFNAAVILTVGTMFRAYVADLSTTFCKIKLKRE